MNIPTIFWTIPVVFLLFLFRSPRKMTLSEKIDLIVSTSVSGAIIQMIAIFLLAGSFAGVMKSIGSVEVLKDIVTNGIPSSFILPGIFILSGLLATALGTSVGTVATMAPICLAVSPENHIAISISAVIAGAYLGDNISMISDTTIAAVKTQEAENDKKFLLNLKLILPAIIATTIFYYFHDFPAYSGDGIDFELQTFFLILPYFLVIFLGLCKIHALMVLLLSVGIAFSIGLLNSIEISNIIKGFTEGMSGMFEISCFVILMSIINSAVRFYNWMDKIEAFIKYLSLKFGTFISFVILFIFNSIANLLTANNTISIIICGDISRDIASKLNIKKEKMAVFIDTAACTIHSVIPYAPQIILASAISHVSAREIIMNSYYSAFIMLSIIIFCILGGGNKKLSN